MRYMDDRLGFISEWDEAYTMDDFGTLVPVPFSMFSGYFQEA